MRFAPSIRIALVVAIVTLVVAGLGFRAAVGQLNIYLRKEPIALRAPLATVPSTLGTPGSPRTWKQEGEDRALPGPIVEELGTEQYLDRVYARSDDPKRNQISVHIAYYTGMIDAVPHVPDRCWVAGGLLPVGAARQVPLPIGPGASTPSGLPSAWAQGEETPAINRATGTPYPIASVVDPITRRKELVHLPVGDSALRTIEFQSETRPDDRLLGGYVFIANGRATPSALEVRSLAFQPRERYAYFCKVQFAMAASGEDPLRWERFAELSADLYRELLPQLMRRLPDWPEVESRSDVASDPQPAP